MKLGIDEVGRGPWAGPMVVGAVVLGDDFSTRHPELVSGSMRLMDSKKLSAKKREKLAYEIKEKAVATATGWVSADEIDNLGLSEALKLATRRAVAKIDCNYSEIIIDGTVKLIDGENVTTMPKADSLIPCVSAASIIAKVARDMYMCKMADEYPDYGFEKHVGYGTKQHVEAIEKYGVLPIHRQSFAPIKKLVSSSRCIKRKTAQSGSTSFSPVEVGNAAEDVATEFLILKGHEILARNWKTKYCEVDIISSKGQTLYFTEVKYRKSDRMGGGIDAIGKKKENQMRYAAKFYLESNEIDGEVDAAISAISITGNPPVVESYVIDIC